MTDNKAHQDWVSALTEFENADLNKTNPHFKSKYADLSAVRKATLPTLKKYNLGIAQKTVIKDGEFVFVARMVHSSGVALDDAEFPLNRTQKSQQIGSEITYAKRYTWSTLCGISADDDDDGNAAQNAPANNGKTNEQQKPDTSDNQKRMIEGAKRAANELKGIAEKGARANLESMKSNENFKTLLSALEAELPEYHARMLKCIDIAEKAIQDRELGDDIPF